MPDYIIPPAGISAASFFSPAVFVDPASPPAILADDVDINTGEWSSLLSFVHPVDAAVKEQLRLRRGTGAAVLDDGSLFHEFDKVLDSTPNAVADEVRRALAPLVDRRDVSLDVVIAEENASDPSMVAAFGEYRNLQTGKKNPLGGR